MNQFNDNVTYYTCMYNSTLIYMHDNNIILTILVATGTSRQKKMAMLNMAIRIGIHVLHVRSKFCKNTSHINYNINNNNLKVDEA